MEFAKFANFSKISEKFRNFLSNSSKLTFLRKNVILELCKGVHCVDLGERFPTHIYLQNFALIQPRTSRLKFAHSGQINRAAKSTAQAMAASFLRDRLAERFGRRPVGEGSGRGASAVVDP